MAHDTRRFYRIVGKDGREWLSRSLSKNHRKVPWSREALELLLTKAPETADSEFMVFDEAKYRRYRVPKEWLMNLPADKLIEAGRRGRI